MSEQNKNKGYIALFRSIQSNFLWSDKPFARGQAWIDLILRANHKDNKAYINNSLEIIKRGEKVTSIRKLSESWGWSTTKVKKFLKELQDEGMIECKSDSKKTVYKVLNYSLYQDTDSVKSDSKVTLKLHRSKTKVNQKNIKSISKVKQKNTNNHVNHDNHVKNDKPCKPELCPEPEQADSGQNTGNVFIELPLNDGSMYQVLEGDIDKWEKLYPAVNVRQAIRNMAGWLDANTDRRKTRRGIRRFIVNWLSKDQDRVHVSVPKQANRITEQERIMNL